MYRVLSDNITQRKHILSEYKWSKHWTLWYPMTKVAEYRAPVRMYKSVSVW